MANDFRICASCAARVPRGDVHKNRYSQYICRQCRSSGVKAVGRKSIRHFVSGVPVVVLGAIGCFLLVVLLVVVVLVASSLHSYSNGGLIDDLKGAVRSLNQLAH